jgi:predicted nucleotidyltransferase
MTAMDRQHILETLRSHQGELQAAGIVHLGLFGSAARSEASPTSDIDLIADFDPSKRLTLVTVGSLQRRLTKMLGAEVDLSSTSWMGEPVRSRAQREAIFAF